MADKLIVSFKEYIKIVEKLAIEIHNNYKPTVFVDICILSTSDAADDTFRLYLCGIRIVQATH